MYISSEKQNLVASFYDDPETVAMFQLFAAAPDMLEALEEAIEILERISYNDGYAHSVALTVQRAIAKAKGEQQ
jgi:hypothetical protein